MSPILKWVLKTYLRVGGGTPKIAVGDVQQMSWNNYTISDHNVIFFYPVSGLTQNLMPLIKTVSKRIATT